MSILTFKKHEVDGVPGFRVYAGAACLGTILDYGPGDKFRWRCLTPHGKWLWASSKTKAGEMLQQHARKLREA